MRNAQLWPLATPESQGIESGAILRVLQDIENTKHRLQALAIVRHGNLVYEGYWAPYDNEILRAVYSCTKSFTSTAIGFAVEMGRLRLEDKVLSFFPEYEGQIENLDDHKRAMTVRHLLTMRTGHTEDTTPKMVRGSNWIKTFLDLPVPHEPGAPFVYNSGGSHMLSAIAQKVLGRPINVFLDEYLFRKIGITDYRWEMHDGVALGGWGLWLKPMDLLKMGYLYLHGGKWNGEQVVPAAWVEECSKKQVESRNTGEFNGDADWSVGYSYQFWMSRYGAYRLDGAGGQQVNIMSKEDMCVMYNCKINDLQYVQDFMNDILVPGIHEEALPEDREAYAALMAKRDALMHPAPQPYSLPEKAGCVLGQIYRMDSNPLGLSTLCIREKEPGALQITLQAEKTYSFLVGMDGVWRKNAWPIEEGSPCAIHAKWDETMLRVEVDHMGPLNQSPFKFMFEGEGVTMEGMVNNARIFEDMSPQLVIRGSRG